MKYFVGTNIRLTINTGIDVTGATLARIKYKKPTNETGYFTATTSDTSLIYDTEDTDIVEPGNWVFQAWVVVDGNTYFGDKVTQKFNAIL